MEFKEIQLQLFLLFHFGLQIAYGVPTLSASIIPPVPVKGSNTHTVMCSYTTGSGESVTTVTLTRGTELIITYYPFNNLTAWSPTVTDAFKQRVTKFGFLSTNVVGITYSNTLCSDEVSYRCEIAVISGGTSLTVSNSTAVSIEAPPQTPVQMIVNPNFQSIQEFNTVTFTCSGNVGKPAGTFQWYMFTAANGINPDNVTSQASTESPVPNSTDCTFTRRSSLTIRLLRKHTDLVVRCRVYHPTQVNNANPTDCTDSSAQFCQSSQNISVTYPVNVTVDTTFRQEVEGNMMSLTCKPEANPKAWLEWFKSDSSVTLSHNELLIFNRLTLADSGDYTCMGYNNISGVIYNASASVSVTVVPTTTPPPTTMRTTTHSSTDSGLHIAYGVPTLNASFTPPVPVKGNNSHSVMCSYITGSGETVSSVTLTRGTELIVTFITVINDTFWSPTVTDAFKQRATKFGSLSTNVIGVTYSSTLCSDEVSYKCEITASVGDNLLSPVNRTTTVSIEAPPQTPVQMIVNPNFPSIQEFTNVTFTCSGNVGKPAGTFHWYMFTAANGNNPDNITLQASTESPVSAGDCTFTRRSSLTIRLLRQYTGLVMRCRVYHPTQVNNANPMDCTNSSAQFCQSSQTISVTYPVNVTVESAFRQEVEGNMMTLTCEPEANPKAWLEWFKSDSNVPLSNSPQLIFTRLTLADSGDYTCMGYNNISGVIYNASATVSVTVVPTTPPPTTTTIRTTMRATTHSNTDSVVTGKQTTNKETASAQCITPDSLLGQGIGIGVGVTLAFTIIVHSLVFIFWKWRHKQKPSGLNGPSINEHCSTRSRSVGDGDYSYYSDIHSNSYDSLRTQEMNLSSYYSALNASNNDRNNR